MKYVAIPFLALALGAVPAFALAPQAPIQIVILPAKVVQGYAVMVELSGVPSPSSVKTITFNHEAVKSFSYKGMATALIGIPLATKVGQYPLTIALQKGKILTRTITVFARPVAKESIPVPGSLGGTTATTTKKLVSSLASENVSLKDVKTATSTLWQSPFALPLAANVVTDPYGYSRQTGAYTIPHLGVDFRAATGTPVYAMNSGVVRVARNFETYGNAVVIDHGLGLSTMYLHLSKIEVSVGQKVTQGQEIARSGETGFADGPHLHVSVDISGISIDPIEFLSLFH